jgi:glycosyltransferase involved in cell wall biosynthesis
LNAFDLVTVVIPTRDRPDLLLRAVNAALGQTHRQLEVLVVIDGADEATERALSQVADERLRWLETGGRLGAAGARNMGVEAAKGHWIAFLDDDDEWLPTKLERQLQILAGVDEPAVASCQIITSTPTARYVGPSRPPREGEHLSEFLFRPRRPYARGARMQTSALLASRQLCQQVPWDGSLGRFQDFDWMLRLADAGARFLVVLEPLSIWYFREDRPTIGGRHSGDWRQALEWIDARRHLVTRRAYARWVLARVSSLTVGAKERPSPRQLWSRARLYGRPGPIDLAEFAYYMFMAPAVRRARNRLKPADR